MKTVLLVLGVIFLVIVVAVVSLLFWAKGSGEDMQKDFFAAVGSGDANRVISLMHPAMKEDVDLPVLAVWVKAFNEGLGEFQKLSPTDFNTSSSYENGHKVAKSSGKVIFKNGDANSDLAFSDGLLVSFHVKSDKLAKDWFKGPQDTAFYRAKGLRMLKLLADNKPDEAHAMMHEALQEKLPLADLRTGTAKLLASLGEVKALAFESEKLEIGEAQELVILYRGQAANGEIEGTVTFRFIGLKGHIIAFNLKPR